jgi:hypothetical protein
MWSLEFDLNEWSGSNVPFFVEGCERSGHGTGMIDARDTVCSPP